MKRHDAPKRKPQRAVGEREIVRKARKQLKRQARALIKEQARP